MHNFEYIVALWVIFRGLSPIPWVTTHPVGYHPSRGLTPTAVFFHRYAVLYGVLRYRGLSPILWVNTHPVGLHPRLWSCHCYAVLYDYYAYRGLSPTAVFFHRYAVQQGQNFVSIRVYSWF